MAKILIYTDLHCSYTSSILPLYLYTDTKFTTRLKMIVDTGKWIADIAEKEKVQFIVNGGDTFDSIIVKAEELEAISEFFKPFEKLNIPHYITEGNHEKVNDNYTAIEILSGFKNIEIIKEPTVIVKDMFSILPYMDAKDISRDLLKSLSNNLLVSHIDIQGSCLRDSYILDSGVNPETLSEYFKFVANGHLHTAEKLQTTQNQVWNIGGVSSISFVDNQEYKPSIVIIDTSTGKFKRYENPHSILFRKYTVSSINDLLTVLKNLDDKYKYALTVKYENYEQKNELQEILDNQKNIIASKLVSSFIAEANKDQEVVEITNLDVAGKFKDFLDTVDLKYEKRDYLAFLEKLT